MSTYEWITTLLVPITGVASWLAATRLRQNTTIRAMQETIYNLVEENKRVYAELTEARRELVDLSSKVSQLTAENADLKLMIEQMMDCDEDNQ